MTATKVALTVWDGRVSPVFDAFREALLLDVAHGQVISTERKPVVNDDPLLKIRQLLEDDVGTVICGAISEGLFQELAARGVRVVSFVAGDVDAVLAAFLEGKLPSPELSLPGCSGGQTRRRFRRRGLRARRNTRCLWPQEDGASSQRRRTLR